VDAAGIRRCNEHSVLSEHEAGGKKICKTVRKIFKNGARVVIRIKGKKILDLSLPAGSSITTAQPTKKAGVPMRSENGARVQKSAAR